MQLRERGIYSLPNGREVVVITRPDNAQIQLHEWKRFDANYEVDGVGRLVIQGKLTAWDVKNLKDTGRTAEHFVHPHEVSSLREPTI
jgi:dolichyl-phosphate-mannose--protein O-mannosyl transferase